MTVTKSISDFTYYMQSGVKPLVATFSNTQSKYCTLQYTFNEVNKTIFNQNVFNASQNSWSMQTNDVTLAGTVYNMVITAYSGSISQTSPKASVTFKVTI